MLEKNIIILVKEFFTNPTENEKLYFDKLQQLMLIDKKDQFSDF